MQVISAYLAHTNQELLLSVIYSRPLLGSSFPIHACLSQMHGQECLQRGVYTQLLCWVCAVLCCAGLSLTILGKKLSS